MKEKGTEDTIKKAGSAMADFLKHVGGKASADKPKASDTAKSSGGASKGAGGGGGGGAF